MHQPLRCALLIALLAGCDGRTGLKNRCTTNEDCAGDVCLGGTCLPPSCDRDTFWDAASEACRACPAGTRSEGGAAPACLAIDCAVDEAWRPDVRSCLACPKGTTSPGGASERCTSIDCAADQRWVPPRRVCEPCPVSTSSDGGTSTVCTAIDCARHERWDVSARACVPCDELASSPGGFVLACTPADCPPDHRWNRALRACEPCPAGEFSTGGAVVACTAIACASNRRWNAVERRCEPCPPGTSSPGGGVVACAPDCAADHRWDTLLEVCAPCPFGTRSNGGTAETCVDVVCDPSQRFDVGTGSCIACPAGYESAGGRDETCLNVDECRRDATCPSGSICVDLPGNYRCDCPAGSFGTVGDCRAPLHITTPFGPSDFDVDASGSPVVVGVSGGAVVARLLDATGVSIGPDLTVRGPNGKPVLKGPWVTRARNSGRFVVLAQQYAAPADIASREDRLDAFAADGSPLWTATLPTDEASSEVALDEAGVVAIATRDVLRSGTNYVWSGPVLTLFAADGALLATADLDFCRVSPASEHAVHLALHPTAGTGVVSCQGHATDPIRWRRFRTDGTWMDPAATTVTSASSWYDSHQVALAADGGVAVFWADYLARTQRAAFYAPSVNLRAAVIVATDVDGFYDTVRRRHLRPALVGDDLLLPFFADDGTRTFKFNALARFALSGTRTGTLTPTGIDTATLAWTPTVSWSLTPSGLVRNPLWVAP